MDWWFIAAIGLLPLFGIYLTVRVPAVWAGAQTPLAGLPAVYIGTARRTYLMFVLAWHAFFDGMFLLFLGMEATADPLWQLGAMVMVFGTTVAVLLWIVVAIFNRPRFLVPSDQREHRSD